MESTFLIILFIPNPCNLKVKKGKGTLFTVVSSVTRLVSMEANGVPFYSPPFPLSVLRFMGI